jgi:two-component system, chemotaxis family, chemotaxis protein CheY
MKILIVDDSKAMRMIVQRSLRSTSTYADAEILQAADGKEALGVIEEQRPDIVLSDWNMPEMTGIELLTQLGERGIDVPLGFVTSESTPEMYELAMGRGARFMVSKPFTPEALEDAMGSV